MADTGWEFPGDATNRIWLAGAGVDWSFPTNVLSDDSSTSQSMVSMDPYYTDQLEANTFDFSSIPVGATIDGIEIRVGDYSLSGVGWGQWTHTYLVVQDGLLSSGSLLGLTAPAGTPHTEEQGSAFYLWGETPSRSDVQNSNWGFAIKGNGGG